MKLIPCLNITEDLDEVSLDFHLLSKQNQVRNLKILNIAALMNHLKEKP